METIWTIIEEAGGLDAAANVRIENPPYQRLGIEMLAEGGPEGHLAVSCNLTDNLAAVGTIIWPYSALKHTLLPVERSGICEVGKHNVAVGTE